MAPAVVWFRRDLRLGDNPALLDACSADGVLPLFVVDDVLWGPAGPSRRGYLVESLRALDRALADQGGALSVVHGEPAAAVLSAARAVGADRVHVAADFGRYGRRRDAAVEAALAEAGIALLRTGSPYAVAPDRVRTAADEPFQVFTPFSRAWAEHGWRGPAGPVPDGVRWLRLDEGTVDLPDVDLPPGLTLPEAGEEAALESWRQFLERRVDDYGDDRNRPDRPGTSRMSHHLKWGEVHPRTLLADLAQVAGSGAAVYRKELAWRDFYADVLWHRPDSATDHLRPELQGLRYDQPGEQLRAWQEGRTGYPVVDAGMRQLRQLGWMHNRVRMIVASFLVKDLHLEFQHGVRHFHHWLVDGDVASNVHGWQWVAGSGTDPAPYFRVFNPTTQGRRFDPDGAYVRRWVEELSDADAVPDPHDPPPAVRAAVGYPEPVVDHLAERREALTRWEELRG